MRPVMQSQTKTRLQKTFPTVASRSSSRVKQSAAMLWSCSCQRNRDLRVSLNMESLYPGVPTEMLPYIQASLNMASLYRGLPKYGVPVQRRRQWMSIYMASYIQESLHPGVHIHGVPISRGPCIQASL